MLLGARTNDYSELCVHHVTTRNWGTVGRLTGFYGVVFSSKFGPPAMNDTTAPNNQNSYGFYIEGDAGWKGYPSTLPDFGSRAWIFFEDNEFIEYGHWLSGFCGSKYVLRHNTIRESGPLDTHESGYNTCWDAGSDPASRHAGWAYEVYDNIIENSVKHGDAINPRSGSGLIYNNTIRNYNNGVQLHLGPPRSGGPRCTVALDCPKTYDFDNGNCTDADDGCCESPHNVWIWGNNCINVNDCFEVEGGHPCIRQDKEYFLRAPTQADDSLSYTAFAYPHPLRGPNGGVDAGLGPGDGGVAAKDAAGDGPAHDQGAHGDAAADGAAAPDGAAGEGASSSGCGCGVERLAPEGSVGSALLFAGLLLLWWCRSGRGGCQGSER